MILSIEESIQRLKAEILAQDWRLSQHRVEQLKASFNCLKQRFRSRKAAYAIIVMADNVLDYVKKKGDSSPPDSVDFVKEAMAHIVTLYEDMEFEPEKEKRLFNAIFFRFNKLKEKIKAEKERETLETTAAAGGSGGAVAAAADRFSPGEAELAEMMAELKDSLQQAETVVSVIRQLLDELQILKPAEPHAPEMLHETASPDLLPEPGSLFFADERQESLPEETPAGVEMQAPAGVGEFAACPATNLRIISIDGIKIGVPENSITMVRTINAAARNRYVETGNVPLKDFHRFMSSLAREFKGSLAKVKNKILKKLTIPIMICNGLDLPSVPDEDGLVLVMVSSGNWNGFILCAEAEADTVSMVRFKKSKHGDISGIASLENGEEIPLLDVATLLRREGYLAVV